MNNSQAEIRSTMYDPRSHYTTVDIVYERDGYDHGIEEYDFSVLGNVVAQSNDGNTLVGWAIVEGRCKLGTGDKIPTLA